MKTQIAKQRKGNGEPIEGWDATQIPTYPPLLKVLEALKPMTGDHITGIAEMGSDCNDCEVDSLGIVWANYAYFTDGDGSLRDMLAWVAVDGDHYYGMNMDGDEWRAPLDDPNTAAQKLAQEPTQ